MQQPMQQQPMQQQQKSPMVQRPQAMQPTSTRVQQPMQRGQLNAPAVMPREMPTPPYDGLGMPGRTIPGTNQNGTRDLGGGRTPEWGPDAPWRKPYNPNADPIYDVNGVEIPRQANTGGNELASTGQRGMPKYDPRGMPGGGGFSNPDPRYTNPMSGGIAGPSREEMAREEAQQAKFYSPGGGKDQAYAAEKQRQLDAGRAQREGALFNPPPPQKPVLQPGEVDMPIGHTGIGFGQDSALARDNPQFGMPPPPEMNHLHRTQAFKRGGKVTSVKKYAKGGTVKSTPVKASSRGDGIAQRGKTKGKIY